MSTRQLMPEQAEEVEELKGLILRHKVVGAASLEKVRAAQLQELRRKLENSAHLRVVKNTIMKRAVAQCKEKPELKKFEEHISGPNIFLFTDLNPFKLAILLQKSKVKTTARAGDIAAEDVVISAGNTGLPPGPVISQLSAVGLPTRIESGSVLITQDTVAAKKGGVIDARLAGVLSKLGIKSVEVGLSMKAAYDDGIIIIEEQLQINLEETRKNLEEANAQAFNLSISAAYPLPKNINFLLQKARKEAHNLAVTANILTPETITDMIRKAQAEALSLSRKVPN